jgi:hypothetical protein
MPKITFSFDQVNKINDLVKGIPDLRKRLGKDGEQIEAFYEDAKEALLNASGDTERELVLSSLVLVALKARECTRTFSFDPLKPFRLLCDDVARTLNFKRYKALRKL